MTTAIIGGTGLERLSPEYRAETQTVDTPFGRAAVVRASLDTQDLIFLSRHGETHGLAPHLINYRANIAALVQLGVTRVLATNAVGSLRLDLLPGSLVLLSDFIDFTRRRPLSYFDPPEAVASDQSSVISDQSSVISHHSPLTPSVIHTDFSEPYCRELRATVEEAAVGLDIDLLPRGTYLCADGPRFETPAEIALFAQWGADVVGMTGLPEAVFAREAGLCYAAVAIVTNFAAGLTPHPVDHNEVVARVAQDVDRVRGLLLAALERVPGERACGCRG